MKYLLLLAFLVFTRSTLKAQMPDVANDAKWVLNSILSDEFSGTTINTTKWKAYLGFEDIMCAPNHECVYDDAARAFTRASLPNENIVLDNGVASVLVRNITTEIYIYCEAPDTYGHCGDGQGVNQEVKYTVGGLVSKNHGYCGYYEVKFRIPGPASSTHTYKPFGANFWLYEEYPMYTTTNTSCYSEIDIFEIKDGQTQKYSTCTHFTPEGNSLCGTGVGGVLHDDNLPTYGAFGPKNITGNEWHIAGVNWTPERIDFYLDGKLIKTNQKDWVSLLDPMRIILNINAPVEAMDRLDNESFEYPYSYDIDYVRVYELVTNCGTDELQYCGSTVPDVADGYTTQKNISFGGNSCSVADYSDLQISLYANEYILIDENITLGGGTDSEIYLDVNSCYP